MGMMRPASLCCLLLAAAGCDQGPARQTKTTKMVVANPFHDGLMTLSELNRSLALRRAVQDAGESCKKIERSAFQGDFKQLKMWTASCGAPRDYALFIAPNGDVQVRRCQHMAELKLPACRTEAAAG